MKKNPVQTDKTRQELKNAYWLLLRAGKKPTVDALSRLAGYNRCTFYRYYTNTDSILDEIEAELCSMIRGIAYRALEKNDPSQFLGEMTSLYEKEGERICFLLGENGDPRFMVMLKEQMAPVVLKYLKLEEYPYRNYIVAFISSTVIQMLSIWYQDKKPFEIKKLTALISRLIYNGLSDICEEAAELPKP